MNKGCKYCGAKITKYWSDISFFGGKTTIGVCDDITHRKKAENIIFKNILKLTGNAKTK